MSRKTLNLHLSDDDFADFETVMAKEGMDKLGPWIKRAARLHADKVLHGHPEEMDEIRDKVQQIYTMLQDITIRLNRN